MGCGSDPLSGDSALSIWTGVFSVAETRDQGFISGPIRKYRSGVPVVGRDGGVVGERIASAKALQWGSGQARSSAKKRLGLAGVEGEGGPQLVKTRQAL